MHKIIKETCYGNTFNHQDGYEFYVKDGYGNTRKFENETECDRYINRRKSSIAFCANHLGINPNEELAKYRWEVC